MNEFNALVRAILEAGPDGAGALADWLDEHDDPRGKLLRKRWKNWQASRLKAMADAVKHAQETEAWYRSQFPAPTPTMIVHAAITVSPSLRIVERIDAAMIRYIRERFPLEPEENPA